MANHERELLKGSTDCLVLSVINSHPSYGYELIKELESRSGGYFHFREGTLYPALHRMEKEGLVEGRWETLPSGQERRYYCITERGRQALEHKRSTWTDFSAAVRSVLSTEPA
ncbi:MAG: helix-turn-helix transcriptional regulator [Dehalococcoidia bacterium]|nr:helix-turn-helix transcriptional regulator [Dehalococcoidia bacterium]